MTAHSAPVIAKCAICGQLGNAADYWYDWLCAEDEQPLCPACMAQIEADAWWTVFREQAQEQAKPEQGRE